MNVFCVGDRNLFWMKKVCFSENKFLVQREIKK